MNAMRKQWLAVAITAVTILTTSSCGPAEATPTTTPGPSTTMQATTEPSTTTAPTTPAPTIAPPTTPAPPTAPTTTTPPTTIPPSSVPATPEEILRQRVLQRFDDITRCYEAPDLCDIDALIDEYYQQGAVVADSLRDWYERFIAENWKWINTDEIDNSLLSVSMSPDGNIADTRVCSRNAATRVDAASGAVIDGEVGYFLYEMTWRRNEGGKWLIVDVSDSNAAPGTGSPCDF